tara:strand:- start:190 stop:519 length:330 start_codon:yes stop_codon:yes gene_type:complete
MSNPNLGGFGRNTWNSGEWNTPFTVIVTGVSSAAAVGSVQIDITVPVTGVSSAAAVGSVQIDITVPLTGVESASILGRVNIWEEINPGQDADWDPITYTQTPSWAKIAA